MFPQHTSWLVQNSLHHSVSKFRVVATLFLTTQECQICVAKQSTMCSDFGFGRMSGFFGHISFYHPHKVWYLLAALSIRNLDLAVGSRMMSYCFRDDLNVLQTLPDNLDSFFPQANGEGGTRGRRFASLDFLFLAC